MHKKREAGDTDWGAPFWNKTCALLIPLLRTGALFFCILVCWDKTGFYSSEGGKTGKNKTQKIVCKSGQHTASLATYFILITQTQILRVVGIGLEFIKSSSKLGIRRGIWTWFSLAYTSNHVFQGNALLWTQLRKSAQMKWPFYVLRAHRSILYNQVDVDGHSRSGRYCSHHTVAPWMLLISGCQQCAVVVPTAGKKYLPQTCMVWIRER